VNRTIMASTKVLALARASSSRALATMGVCAALILGSALAPVGNPASSSPLVAALSSAGPDAALAAQLRYMGWNKYDVLLDRHETSFVTRSMSGAASICWQLGIAGRFGIVPCVSMVSVCGAHGRIRGRRAGMTFQPFSGWRFWCWQYG
jgi:hypothetical protein